MIPHATENAQIGSKADQFADGVIERIAHFGNQIAGEHGEVGAQTVGHVNHPARSARTQKRADVKIAHLDDAEAIEVGMEVRHGEIEFPDTVLVSLDEHTEGGGCDGRANSCHGNGAQHAATARRMHAGNSGQHGLGDYDDHRRAVASIQKYPRADNAVPNTGGRARLVYIMPNSTI